MDEAARGRGVRRTIGELLVCDFCLAQWVSAGFVALFAVAPRYARAIAAIFTVYAASDVARIAYVKLRSTA